LTEVLMYFLCCWQNRLASWCRVSSYILWTCSGILQDGSRSWTLLTYWGEVDTSVLLTSCLLSWHHLLLVSI